MWNFRFPLYFSIIQPDVYFGTTKKEKINRTTNVWPNFKIRFFWRWLNLKWNEFSVVIHRTSGGFIGCCWIVKVCHCDKNKRMQSVRLSACTSTTKHFISSLMLTSHIKRVNYCDAVSCRLTLFISCSGNSNILVYRLKFYYMEFIVVMVRVIHALLRWMTFIMVSNKSWTWTHSICLQHNTLTHIKHVVVYLFDLKQTNDWVNKNDKNDAETLDAMRTQ